MTIRIFGEQSPRRPGDGGLAAPTIYAIAGCNGAGKTTFAKEFLPSIGVIRFLNADEIARALSPLRPELVAFKAGKLLLTEMRELINRGETFALESTLSGKTYVKIFQNAKQRGCDRIALRVDSRCAGSDPARSPTSN